MPSIFSKIISGDIPAHKVAEDDRFLAFLDINPLAEGHTLVIPKKEVDNVFNLDEETYEGLWKFARRVAIAIDACIPCERVGVAVIGLEVPHAHIHLVPIRGVYDIDFSKPKLTIEKEQMENIARLIAEHLV